MVAGVSLKNTKNLKRTKNKAEKNKSKKKDDFNFPPPPAPPVYGSLADPDSNIEKTTLTTGLYSSAGGMHQAKPGDAIPYGTGFSYGNVQTIKKTKKDKKK